MREVTLPAVSGVDLEDTNAVGRYVTPGRVHMRRGLIAALLVSVGTMIAPQMASAGVFVGQTNLTIHVQQDVVTGMLVGRPECRGNQTIDLYVDGVWVDATTTDSSGNYAFAFTAVPPTTVQTRFAGSKEGVHPNNHDCLPADSRVVVVNKVKTANGPAKTVPAAAAIADTVAAMSRSIGHAFAS
jgi:hypothetical protein